MPQRTNATKSSIQRFAMRELTVEEIINQSPRRCQNTHRPMCVMPAAVLLATGVLKAFVTPLCIELGWKGGDLFPCIFAGVATDYGLAALTGADAMLMVTVTTTAFLAGVTKKPLLALGILAPCFPMRGILYMGLAALAGAAFPIPATLVKRPGANK